MKTPMPSEREIAEAVGRLCFERDYINGLRFESERERDQHEVRVAFGDLRLVLSLLPRWMERPWKPTEQGCYFVRDTDDSLGVPLFCDDQDGTLGFLLPLTGEWISVEEYDGLGGVVPQWSSRVGYPFLLPLGEGE